MLMSRNGDTFASIKIECDYSPLNNEEVSRVKIPVTIATNTYQAYIDTGAPYTLLNNLIFKMAKHNNLEHEFISQGDSKEIIIRRTCVKGELYNVKFTFQSTSEQNMLELELKCLILDESTPIPIQGVSLILGMQNSMDQLKFALDLKSQPEICFIGQ